MSETTFEKGLQIRNDVVGENYVTRSFENAGDFGHDFQKLVTEFCWGASWGREALTRRDRSLLNLVIIGTLGRSAEFKLHVRGALRNGVSVDEIKDALIHLSVYSGIPAGVEAFRLAKEVLDEAAEQQADQEPRADQRT
ncbi:carboxymuconolactone decarboxylase family protein [Paenarthrobacter nitroguajacolicus]|uniref:carboxymuconolactone decarboxylase family protein n=1 Tax=Paenarthrobacter nitroguajacolicus TaxID=211146 RepID=UPI000A5BDA11|nr:carboxymuconolactone decarboxylase family protein [Paenarthrobacter nitroguajacolicus]